MDEFIVTWQYTEMGYDHTGTKTRSKRALISTREGSIVSPWFDQHAPPAIVVKYALDDMLGDLED